jgi:hypothetical protein
VLEQAQDYGLDMGLTRLVDSFYAEGQELGGARWHTSSLLPRLQAKHNEGQI